MALFSDNLRIIFNQYMENLSLTRNECSCMIIAQGELYKVNIKVKIIKIIKIIKTRKDFTYEQTDHPY